MNERIESTSGPCTCGSRPHQEWCGNPLLALEGLSAANAAGHLSGALTTAERDVVYAIAMTARHRLDATAGRDADAMLRTALSALAVGSQA